ncbi:sugar phosphate isomerase/epimerase family protein [Catalinimonas niigatensis]|uniref:sugar phosphate isomerase/epimerase family protein n=1 Tax=Catalinimonas niigatensis TaxID=1397264 RepID=UPI0026656F70|nr:TIM barrel protein [Catalinimonas niigatensis]WPP50728.1 TIM barrel protein [Catalinimonas niigatensis]
MQRTYQASLFQHLALLSILSLWGCTQTQENAESGNTTADSTQTMQFSNYPELKLGFTTQNFLPVMPVNLENSKKLIDYATGEGYAWIELRDPSAELTLDEAQQLSDYAQEKNIEVSYAIQKGLLDNDFWPTFSKGVKNAAVFEGPGIIRSLGSFAEFNADTNKQGWTAEELEQLVLYADSAAAMAEENGLQYVIENASESFFGKSNEYFGISDLFARTSENVGWQFDTANPFSVSRVHPPADSILTFLEEHADNLYYIHLKSAKDGQAQATLMENPLAFDTVFQIMSENNIPYVAIELQAVDNEEQAFGNMEESVNYLKEQGFIANP